MFAKLYGSNNDQVLVILCEEDAPQIQFHFQPEGLGVCKIGITFPDTDAGQACAEKMLEDMTEDKARATVGKAMETLSLEG